MKEHRDTQVPLNMNQGFTSSLFNCYSQPKASTLPWKVSQESYYCGTCVHGSWDDEPVFHAVFMKCAYRNSLCPVKPQF